MYKYGGLTGYPVLHFLHRLTIYPSSSWIYCYYSVLWKFCSFESVRPGPSCSPAVRKWGGCWDGPTHNPGSGYVQ